MDKKPAPQPSITARRVIITVDGDVVILRLADRPGVESRVSTQQLERWAIRQMREGVFA